jgi:hypothetical protein
MGPCSNPLYSKRFLRSLLIKKSFLYVSLSKNLNLPNYTTIYNRTLTISNRTVLYAGLESYTTEKGYIKRVEGNKIVVEGIDILDGTPLLDIKPYIEKFDTVKESTSGWLQASDEGISKKRSDNRFG